VTIHMAATRGVRTERGTRPRRSWSDTARWHARSRS
jgi:hypothetical protein